MNIIHSEKTIAILPERTATRAISQLLNHWDVYTKTGEDGGWRLVGNMYNNGEFSQALRHEWRVNDIWPEMEPTYKIFLTVRNPYARMLSYYKSLWLKLDCGAIENGCNWTFQEFLNKECRRRDFKEHLEYERIFDITNVDYIIRVENITEDVLKVPMFKQKYETSEEFRKDYDRVILNNIFDKESKNTPPKYRIETARIVYELFENQFAKFGYDKDSWMYL